MPVILTIACILVLGGRTFRGGRGGVGNAIPGILIIVLAGNLTALYGISPNERVIWIARILPVFLILQRLLKR